MLPQTPAFRDPLLGDAQPLGDDATCAHTPDLPRPHEPARLQQTQMLHDRGQGNAQRLRQFTHCSRPAAQLLYDGAPGRIGESFEQVIECRRLVSHFINYSVASNGVNQ